MQDCENPTPVASKRIPWNKGKLTGAKPPLRPKHVWSIRTKLQMADRKRDLALFNLAIDSKLRGCDVIALKVEDIAPHGYAIERATVRQKKTSRPVRFEITEQTRQAVDDYLSVANRKRGDFLFAAQRQPDRGLSIRQYARLVGDWIPGIGLGAGLRIVQPYSRARYLSRHPARPSDLKSRSARKCGPGLTAIPQS